MYKRHYVIHLDPKSRKAQYREGPRGGENETDRRGEKMKDMR